MRPIYQRLFKTFITANLSTSVQDLHQTSLPPVETRGIRHQGRLATPLRQRFPQRLFRDPQRHPPRELLHGERNQDDQRPWMSQARFLRPTPRLM